MSKVLDRIEAWLAKETRSRWTARVRKVMNPIVETWSRCAYFDNDEIVKTMLVDIDAAYPFGSRSHAPYKAWLAERKSLVDVLTEPLKAPTAEDYGACEVAIDLVEQGDSTGAQKLLDEQAPRRLNRECPVCGAAAGNSCHDRVETIEQAAPRSARHVGQAYLKVALEYRIVPHLSRVMPQLANGPLFGARE